MSATIELEGFEEVEELLRDLELDESTKKKAVKVGIDIIADSIESNSPKKTGRLSKIKRKVENTGLVIEGTANSTAFYDKFQDIGTSQQKKNVGYFDRAVDSSVNEAIKASTEVLFSKVR
ncbi:HK97-gp10 family putative phage morphogenesis protein [Clostridium perfringens]